MDVERLAREYVDAHEVRGEGPPAHVLNLMVEAFHAGAREALEEAAKICDARAEHYIDAGPMFACEMLAAAIRALIAPEP
jgi:hypothetical protein